MRKEMNEAMMAQVAGGANQEESVKGRNVYSIGTRGEGVIKTPDEVAHWGFSKKRK